MNSNEADRLLLEWIKAKCNMYNGYRNWETWNLALWLMNDEAIYHAAREAARGGPDELREMVEDEHPLAGLPSWYSDVINMAIADVAWDEVIAALLDA